MRTLLLTLVLVASLVANAVASQTNACAMQAPAAPIMADCPMMGDSQPDTPSKTPDMKSVGCLVACYGLGAQTLPVSVVGLAGQLPGEKPATITMAPLISTPSGVPTPPPDFV
jgi:hypothetical protein